jgi:glutathione S-transferase
MYTVYGRIGTGSIAVEAVLEEIGAPYETRNVPKGADGRPERSYFAINPQGRVPSLALADGRVMTESAAIVLYLADTHAEAKLAPAPADALRPDYLRWMLFMASGIYNSDLIVAYAPRYTSDPNGGEGVRTAALATMAEEWRILADALGYGPYILGNAFSAADIYAAMLMTWNDDVPAFFRIHPKLKAHHDRVAARPAVARVWKRHEIEV